MQPCLMLPFFRNQPEICVASALQTYVKVTAKLRDPMQSDKSLFISFRKPHKVVTAQTLARWIKNVLKKSGFDTYIFTAHSTRHASISAANGAGINIDTIRQTAGWSQRSSVFARFYNKSLDDRNAFATAIIN